MGVFLEVFHKKKELGGGVLNDKKYKRSQTVDGVQQLKFSHMVSVPSHLVFHLQHLKQDFQSLEPTHLNMSQLMNK